MYCYQYTAEKDGVTLAQSVDATTLQTLLQSYKTSSGDSFILVVQSDISTFTGVSRAFSARFTIKVGSVDINSLVAALTLSWQAKLGVDVDITFVWQEELFNENG